jgi:hypothetical protein
MKNESTPEIVVDSKRDAEPKILPLFARFVQSPKVRSGVRSGVRNLV